MLEGNDIACGCELLQRFKICVITNNVMSYLGSRIIGTLCKEKKINSKGCCWRNHHPRQLSCAYDANTGESFVHGRYRR
jgi:hypothetical protein